MATLDRRIEALEQSAAGVESVRVIAIQIVSPGELEPKNNYCEIDGVTYTRFAQEAPCDFDSRMRSVAEDLNNKLGRPIRIICSALDLSL